MPDKAVGWRKKISHAARPKTPILPKHVGDDKSLSGDLAGRRSHPADMSGWRKTIHGSIPEASASRVAPLSSTADDEDTRSERSETSTTNRKITPRPKLSRYLSGYLAIKEASKEPEFPEPWSEDALPAFVPLIDPLVVLQSVHTHLVRNSSRPIPVEHHSGILRIFEDYKKVREEKERLHRVLQETLSGYEAAEKSWEASEDRYHEEIRRLDLLVARSDIGMAG